MNKSMTVALLVLASIAGAMAFTSLQHFLPRIHGSLSPVLDPLVVETVTDKGDGWSRIAGTSRKHKDCSWVRTEWFVGDLGGRAASTKMVYGDKPQTRGPGLLSWSKIDVLLSPAQIRTNSYAYVYHDCGWPWLIRSLYYQSE